MEITAGAKPGVDSPAEKILGSAQESYCQHPGSTLSPAPLHRTAWLSARASKEHSLKERETEN